jgi:beta-aspartyl-peptidase (threonine type)
MPTAIIVHGGAGTVTPDRTEIVQQGCREAAMIGWRILQTGGSALDAVEAAVRALEDNPEYNAGTGSCLTSDGNIELDAGIMEGHTLQVGAVACVELIKNPISLARNVMESPHALLVGKGAQAYALERGIPLCELEDLVSERQYQKWLQQKKQTSRTSHHEDEPRHHRREVASIEAREERHGTVGAVAIDMEGHLAAATSTGGISNQYPGRVGDSPLVGCGFYADDNAAISCTGDGEDFMRLMVAKRAADYVAHGESARDAATSAITFLGARATGTGGLIVVDRKANVGFAWNSSHMKHAYITEGMDAPESGI